MRSVELVAATGRVAGLVLWPADGSLTCRLFVMLLLGWVCISVLCGTIVTIISGTIITIIRSNVGSSSLRSCSTCCAHASLMTRLLPSLVSRFTAGIMCIGRCILCPQSSV